MDARGEGGEDVKRMSCTIFHTQARGGTHTIITHAITTKQNHTNILVKRLNSVHVLLKAKKVFLFLQLIHLHYHNSENSCLW